MIKEVKIKPGCIACHTCERICPSIFHVEDSSKVISKDFSKYEDAIFKAAQNCPVQVIHVTDDAAPVDIEEKDSFTSVLLARRKLTPNTYEFEFEAPAEADFKPGQFASVTLEDGAGSFVRCYSIKSWKAGRIAFCIRLLPKGRGSSVLARLKPGDGVRICAGVGTFTLKPTEAPKLFVATGTGIAPIMAMIAASPKEAPMKLLFGARNEEDVLYAEELKKYPNLHVEVWLSNPKDATWPHLGRVTKPLEKFRFPTGEPLEVYVCGNPFMVKSVLEIFEKKALPHVSVDHELFTPATTTTPQYPLGTRMVQAVLPVLQRLLLVAASLTPLMVIFPQSIAFLWDLSLYAVILLMLIRPLRDITGWPVFSRLIVLRKELGIFSASVVVSAAMMHYLAPDFNFLQTYFSWGFWSFENNQFWAHLAELTGVILLVTSNTLSQRVLGKYWKRIQRLSYVYFFAGSYYVWASFGKTIGILGIVVVFLLTFVAYLINKSARHA